MRLLLSSCGVVFILLAVALLLFVRGCGAHIQPVDTIDSLRGHLQRAYLSSQNQLLLEASDRYAVIDLNKEFAKFDQMQFEKIYLQATRWSDFHRGKPAPELLRGFNEILFVKNSSYEVFWALHDGRSPLQITNASILLLYREFNQGRRSWAHFHLFLRYHESVSARPVRKAPYAQELRHEFFIEQPVHRSYHLETRPFIDG